MKHKVSICVSRDGTDDTDVVKSGSHTMRSKLLNFLFGEKVGVFILTPGKTVETVEIHEVAAGGELNA